MCAVNGYCCVRTVVGTACSTVLQLCTSVAAGRVAPSGVLDGSVYGERDWIDSEFPYMALWMFVEPWS